MVKREVEEVKVGEKWEWLVEEVGGGRWDGLIEMGIVLWRMVWVLGFSYFF